MEGSHFIVLNKIIIHSGLELKGENGLSLSFEKCRAEMVPDGGARDPWACKRPTRSLFKNVLTYFWLCWVFVAVSGLFLVATCRLTAVVSLVAGHRL